MIGFKLGARSQSIGTKRPGWLCSKSTSAHVDCVRVKHGSRHNVRALLYQHTFVSSVVHCLKQGVITPARKLPLIYSLLR